MRGGFAADRWPRRCPRQRRWSPPVWSRYRQLTAWKRPPLSRAPSFGRLARAPARAGRGRPVRRRRGRCLQRGGTAFLGCDAPEPSWVRRGQLHLRTRRGASATRRATGVSRCARSSTLAESLTRQPNRLRSGTPTTASCGNPVGDSGLRQRPNADRGSGAEPRSSRPRLSGLEHNRNPELAHGARPPAQARLDLVVPHVSDDACRMPILQLICPQ